MKEIVQKRYNPEGKWITTDYININQIHFLSCFN